MSFELRGKPIWGSPVFRILVELESKRFEKDFRGEITLFERRHEVTKKKFKSLDMFITTLRDFWQQSLRIATVQEARLARWIEELLAEFGMNVPYSDILDAIKGQFTEVPPIEVEDEVELTDDEISQIVPQASDKTITGVTRTLKGAVDDEEAMEKILESFLHQYKPKRTNSTISNISYEHEGKEKKTEHSFVFETSPIKEIVILKTEFNNPHKDVLTNVVMVDLIPNDYQLLETRIVGNVAEKIEEEEKHEGLLVTWKISELLPTDSITFEYDLTPKMLRTIIVRDDNDLSILQLQDDVHIDGSEVWIDSSYTFQDRTPIIEDVKVLDQIPKNLLLVKSTPDIAEPRGKLVDGPQGTDVIWTFRNIPALTKMRIEYELKQTPRMYREVISVIDNKDQLVADVVKIVKPLENKVGLGVVYMIKPRIKYNMDIRVEDSFPSDYQIESILTEQGVVDKNPNGEIVQISWTGMTTNANREIHCYMQLLGDLKAGLPLDFFSIKSTSHNVDEESGSENNHKKEKLIMSDVYTLEVDSA